MLALANFIIYLLLLFTIIICKLLPMLTERKMSYMNMESLLIEMI